MFRTVAIATTAAATATCYPCGSPYFITYFFNDFHPSPPFFYP
ncbi:MAG: hypothetical protein ABIL90_01895 [candidate division WOR-3 bacterium]